MTERVLSVRRYAHSDATGPNDIAGYIGRPGVGDVIEGELNITGWCASPARAIEHVIAYVGGARVDFEANLSSPDVAAAHPGLMGGAACRFRGSMKVAPTPRAQVIELCVIYRGGQISPFGEILLSAPVPAGEALDGPVFVVGSPRSGTTILGNTIRYSLGLTGFDEAQFLPLLRSLSVATKSFYDIPHYAQQRQTKGTMISHIGVSVVESRIAHMFRELFASLHNNAPFVDKTPGPGMLRAIPLLLVAWPNARFIFAMRRAIENLISRERKFSFTPESFEVHCKDWAEAMNLWSTMRATIPENQRMEVDQLDIVRDVSGVSQKLAAFCGIPRKAADFATYISTHQPQKTTDDDWKILDLSEVGWDPQRIATFNEVCGLTMTAWGYTVDSSYRTTCSEGSGT